MIDITKPLKTRGGQTVNVIGMAEVVRFLMGEAPLEGRWFDEPDPHVGGAYWWRKHLTEALAQQPAAVDAALVDAERYRLLRKGAVEDVAVVRGLGAMDYGMSAVVATYSEEIDGDDLDAAIDAAQQPAATSETVNVIGMPEFDGLLDYIYEHGTAAEGVIEKANAFARAVIARFERS